MNRPPHPRQGQDSSPLVAAPWGDHASTPHRAHSVVSPRCLSVAGVIPQLKKLLHASLLSYSSVSPSAPSPLRRRNPRLCHLSSENATLSAFLPREESPCPHDPRGKRPIQAHGAQQISKIRLTKGDFLSNSKQWPSELLLQTMCFGKHGSVG